jgi:putative MATE family efflux protein
VSAVADRRARWPRLCGDDRQIALLALPALGALAAEPLYVLVDTAIIGHLGVAPLAALALAGAVLSAITALCNFLEYGSTPKVGRLSAVGDGRAAAQLGRQAVLLGLVLGVALAVAAATLAAPLTTLLGGHGRVAALAAVYLRIAALGLPWALVAVAAQGYFRGIRRLRLPLMVLLAGNALNALLELWFVDALHWGISGSAWGTVIAQTVMAAAYAALLVRAGREGPLIDWPALRSLALTGGEIFVRTGSLYASFLLAGAILARVGSASLAAHQVVFQLWNFLALALDALAIAAQVLISHQLAVSEPGRARQLARRTLIWSLVVGALFAAIFLALGGVLPRVFSSNPRVLNRVHAVWPVFALMQPVNAVVFALDGILIGAGDTRYLMWAMVPCTLFVFMPLALAALLAGWGIVGVWLAILAFILARLLLCGWRYRGDAWTQH